jgi:glycosyltransferase involved in cell wall biosynthesis
MRILAFTGGAGRMYCGSCLRDNALAAELIARGHDVTLVPLYTPTRTDEANVSGERVFFGGISVYLEQHVPLLRRTPAILDRLWDAGPVIRAFSGRGVSVAPGDLGALTVSMLEGEEGFQAKEVRKLLDWLRAEPAFDIIVLPYTLLLGLAPALKRETGRPLACTLQGEDLFLEGLPEPHRSRSKELIRRHQASVDGFLAVSDYYAGFMAGYLGVPRQKIRTVPIGVNLAGLSPRESRPPGPFTVGYLARVAPEKGLDMLAEAYRRMRERGLPPSRLEAAGYLAPEHRAYLGEIERKLREWGLADEFRYHGEVDRGGKIRFLRGLDVLSVPSPYVEPKGLYLLEALASGVAVVSPRHGAFPEILARTGGGVLFEPGDLDALARELLSLHRDPERAQELGRQGTQGVRAHYGVARMGELAVEAYAALAGVPSASAVSSRQLRVHC